MSVHSGQTITPEFVTSNPATQAAVNADSLPSGTLVVNGTDNAASVTVTNIDAGRYKAAVTLPTLASGDIVELMISATVSTIAGKGVVWRDTATTTGSGVSTYDGPHTHDITVSGGQYIVSVRGTRVVLDANGNPIQGKTVTTNANDGYELQ